MEAAWEERIEEGHAHQAPGGWGRAESCTSSPRVNTFPLPLGYGSGLRLFPSEDLCVWFVQKSEQEAG